MADAGPLAQLEVTRGKSSRLLGCVGLVPPQPTTAAAALQIMTARRKKRHPGPHSIPDLLLPKEAERRVCYRRGDAVLAAYWEDPDFDPAQAAFYYVRVREIPTPL
jgi:hypothetical protein